MVMPITREKHLVVDQVSKEAKPLVLDKEMVKELGVAVQTALDKDERVFEFQGIQMFTLYGLYLHGWAKVRFKV